MFRHTSKLLKIYWDDVKLLAHQLYVKRKLQNSDIKQLLLKKSPNKNFWKKQFKTMDTLFSSIDILEIMHIIEKI